MGRVMLDSNITIHGELFSFVLFLIFVLFVIYGLAADIIKYFKKESYFFVHYTFQMKDGQLIYNSSYLHFKSTRVFSCELAAETLKSSHSAASVLVTYYHEVSKKEYEYNVK